MWVPSWFSFAGEAGAGHIVGETSPVRLSAGLQDPSALVARELLERARSEAGYTATYYLRMLSELGGLETARKLLHASGVSDGFTHLWERRRLDLTVEAVVLEPRFANFFTDEELDIARQRLAEFGYRPPDSA